MKEELKARFYAICDAIIAAYRQSESDCVITMRPNDAIEIDTHTTDETGKSITDTMAYMQIYDRYIAFWCPFIHGEHVSKDCTRDEWLDIVNEYIPVKEFYTERND